jgi:magnesium-transporting ATPase (P-type)
MKSVIHWLKHFSGALVLQGTATGAVVATGGSAELGRINALLNQTGQLETPNAAGRPHEK